MITGPANGLQWTSTQEAKTVTDGIFLHEAALDGHLTS